MSKNHTLTAALLGATLLLSACSAIRRDEAQRAEDLMVVAGCKVMRADEPAETAKLQAMKPALRVVPRRKDGVIVYTYADPYNCMCVYVCTQDNYAEYRELALEKQIAEDKVQAAEANEAASMDMGWYWW